MRLKLWVSEPDGPGEIFFAKSLLRHFKRSPNYAALFRALVFDTLSRLLACGWRVFERKTVGSCWKGIAVRARNSFRNRLEKISARFGKIRLPHNRIPLMSALPAAKGLRSHRQWRVFRLWSFQRREECKSEKTTPTFNAHH